MDVSPNWWEAKADATTEKWETLEHNGVMFPPPYKPLPSHIKMRYNGKELDLPPASEEVAGFYATLIETEYAQSALFNKNFFEDWKAVLKDDPPRDGTQVTSFELCDFGPMYEYFEAEKSKKKAMTSEEKKELKRVINEQEAKYLSCLLDGREEKVGNFRVDPPGLFRGRGDHPKKGCLKFRLRPDDITINIGKNAPVPVPNVAGQWKNIIHDRTVTWIASWIENVNGNHKYVFLAAGSSLKGQSDMNKFEKARELKNHIDGIRRNYNADLDSEVMADRQRATAMYFIDKLALRTGDEKDDDEWETVGCCSLKCKHVTLEAPNFIIFDFLGQDSFRFYNRVPGEPQICRNIRIFKENKNDDDDLFDRVNTTGLNEHLQSEMTGLTAMIFRTFNASITLQRLLDETTLENTLQEKVNAYNKATLQVAILCNHRTFLKTHDQSLETARDKLWGLKYNRMKLRHALFELDEKFKKHEDYMDDESDIDEWIINSEEANKTNDMEKAEKTFKENDKLEEEGKRSIDEIQEAISKLADEISMAKLQVIGLEENREIALILSTCKINYLDPRITASWSKIHSVPVEKLFSQALRLKFQWAMEVAEDWKF
ncbi:hypothetical protein K438DRAFT_22969 [Mycena galopus ATCC 62051]|nr:hypothetical protein K438DRAFT_22969 [Mycena galopus ATCC 62051]